MDFAGGEQVGGVLYVLYDKILLKRYAMLSFSGVFNWGDTILLGIASIPDNFPPTSSNLFLSVQHLSLFSHKDIPFCNLQHCAVHLAMAVP